MNKIHTPETAYTMLGVEGRMFDKVLNTETGLFLNQKFKATRPYNPDDPDGPKITVKVRFDDSCGNGHQSFSIITESGCAHDDVAKLFPELAHLIKWHLTSTNGPMHYIANTCFHASNLDHYGLAKGEKRQIINGKSGLLAWILATVDDTGNEVETEPKKSLDSAEKPAVSYRMEYVPWTRTGEGKERQLDYARRSAVWPEATDEQLCLPRAELEALLMARQPALMAAFRADMESIGMLWEQPVESESK